MMTQRRRTETPMPLQARKSLALAAETLRTGVAATAAMPIVVVVRPEQQKKTTAAAEAEVKPKAVRRRGKGGKAKMAMRLAYLEERTVCVRDNTQTWRQPGAVITADAVHAALTLEPRKAVPLRLPVLHAVERWLKVMKRVLIG